MKIELKPGNRWDMINALNVGASKTLCVRHPEYYDPRPYGIALLEAYPLLKDNALGRGTDAARQLLLDGIANRSQPRCVAALLAHAPTSNLTAEQAKTLNFLIGLARCDLDLQGVFS